MGWRRKKPAELSAEQQAAAELVRRAREQGLSTGPDGLLKQADEDAARTVRPELGWCGHDGVEFGRRQGIMDGE